MKQKLQILSRLVYLVLPATALMCCSWESPGFYNYSNRVIRNSNKIVDPEKVQKDTLPKAQQESFDKAMQEMDIKMKELDTKMKDMKVDIDLKLDALSQVNLEAIQKQTEASLKQIDWNKMQQDINTSVKNVQDQVAKIDLSKMKIDMQALQEKLQSEQFKSQFNAEKMQKQINEAMENAKVSMEKAKQKMQQIKAFTDELAAEGLIDKKKGYKLEWKSGELYINGQKQSKDISDKYRRYENSGKIKILPEGAEHF